MFQQEDENQESTFVLTRRVLALIVGGCLLIVIGGIWAYSALRVQHDLINPQLRQNLVDDPQRTIDVRSGFHTKLGEVISSDNTIIALINQMQQYCTTHTPCQDNYYDNLAIQLTGDEEIRTNAINDYNAYANNPDDGAYRDSWLPTQLDTTPLPSTDQQIVQDLSQEVRTLSAANSREN